MNALVRIIRRFSIISLMCLCVVGHTKSQTKSQEEYRDLFEKAEWAATHSSSKQFRYVYNKLDDYPLKPYAQLKFLKRRAYLAYEKPIHEFLSLYEATPLDRPLRQKWLMYLAKKGYAERYIRDYRPSLKTEFTCYNLRFLKQLNRISIEQYFDEITALWLVGKSQPKACDPLFKHWIEAGYMTSARILMRVELAATDGKHTLIPYLKKQLPDDKQYLAELWYQVRRNPAYMQRLSRFKYFNADEKRIAIYGIKRLIWRNKKAALALYPKLESQFSLTAADKGDIAYRFAIRLAAAHDKRAATWLKRVPDDKLDDSIVHWTIADKLRLGEWRPVLDYLEALPHAISQRIAWRYWRARALIELGYVGKGHQLMAEVAKNRHYYGFMAAGLLGHTLSYQDKPLVLTSDERTYMQGHPAWRRAKELLIFKRIPAARREWAHMLKSLSSREQQIAARLAYEAKWFDRAIFALPMAGYMDDVTLRFPLAYVDTFKKHGKKHKVDPAFAMAIARRESSFMADANSSAGAVGLMQVLPSTVRYITKRSVKKSKLFKADANVRYGTQYLSYLMGKTKKNIVLTTAGYNGGIHRVLKWADKPIPADVFIETIPFKETREYVKSVLAYWQIYSMRLGREDNRFIQLAAMQIGK